jgi:hypothetical protein
VALRQTSRQKRIFFGGAAFLLLGLGVSVTRAHIRQATQGSGGQRAPIRVDVNLVNVIASVMTKITVPRRI